MVRIGLILCICLVQCAPAPSEPLNPERSSEGQGLELDQAEGKTSATQLLSTRELFELRAAEEVVLIDVDPLDVYQTGHIPGAHQLWRPAITSKNYGYGGMALERTLFEGLLDSLGVTARSKVVVYDGSGGCDAARLWWMLRLYGHTESYLLDGGATTFCKDTGCEIGLGNPAEPEASAYRFPSEIDSSYYVSYDWLLAALEDTTVLILDTRTWPENAGIHKKSGAALAGRIPGAVWWDWGNALAGSSSDALADEATIRDRLRAARVGELSSYSKIVTYCHSGVRSAHTAFVLREVFGLDHVANYDGSWTEWSHMPGAPIEIIEHELP